MLRGIVPEQAAMAFELVTPTRAHLPRYVAALERGWSPDNLRGAAAAAEELEAIRQDTDAFVRQLFDPEAKGPPVKLPDGSQVPRLPGYRLWMWEDDFIGSIGLRWQPGTSTLPPHVTGHIGYAVVPWMQRRGYAREALRLMLARARAQGLAYVEITTDPDNVGSRRVIESNGGVVVGRFNRTVHFGGTPALRYRVPLAASEGAVAIRFVLPGEEDVLPGLCGLLQDCVEGGASIGFVASLAQERAERYWRQVLGALGEGLQLWVALVDGEVAGSVQLAPSAKDNAPHRAEVQKLLVATRHRGRGIASRLMGAAESHARANGRWMLVLDTETGSFAESVYRHLGWRRAGEIPDYALTPGGRLHPTTYYYKRLAN
jgi:predicted acetyltransferase/predicted GNAT family acetyltransferase